MRLEELNVGQALKEKLAFARIEKVAINRAKETMEIYFYSERLFYAEEMEQIKQQLVRQHFPETTFKISFRLTNILYLPSFVISE